jgi:uncharacterized protein (DUF1330 family)
MAAYLIVDTDLHDADTYKQYMVKAKPHIESYGGEYLARGGELVVLERDLWEPTRIVIIKFADKETARRCLESPEYQAILPISQRSAKRTALIVDGI